MTMGRLAEHLESMLGEIMWNDASMDGEYDFVVPVADLNTARQSLLSKYGIALDTASRPVNVLVIESKR